MSFCNEAIKTQIGGSGAEFRYMSHLYYHRCLYFFSNWYVSLLDSWFGFAYWLIVSSDWFRLLAICFVLFCFWVFISRKKRKNVKVLANDFWVPLVITIKDISPTHIISFIWYSLKEERTLKEFTICPPQNYKLRQH